jgi:isoleucyl-tRNA synthetase
MQAYNLSLVVTPILGFIDDLTNWYIRVNRRRFWDGKDTEAFDALFSALVGFSKILAPFAPFTSDYLFRQLTHGMDLEKSVHLCDIPLAQPLRIHPHVEHEMQLIQTVTNLARSLRQKQKLKIRQPLQGMLVITADSEDQKAIESYQELLLSELSLKTISYTVDEMAHVRLTIKPNLKTLGRKLGKDLPKLGELLKGYDQEDVTSLLKTLNHKHAFVFCRQDLTLEDFLVERGPLDDRLIATEGGTTILLDTELSPALIQEGLAREIINRVQGLRKEKELAVTDRINLKIRSAHPLIEAAHAFSEFIQNETLATEIDFASYNEEHSYDSWDAIVVEGYRSHFSLSREE